MRLKKQANTTSKNRANAPKKSPKRTKSVSKSQKTSKKPQDAPHKAQKPLTKSEFTALQKKWYAKLAEDGFKDLERLDRSGEPGPLLHGQSLVSIAKLYSPLQERYYFKLRNFLTHVPNWTKSRYDRDVALLYTEGKSYRHIVDALRWHRKGRSVFSVHHAVKRFVKLALEWNKRSPQGADYVADLEPLNVRTKP